MDAHTLTTFTVSVVMLWYAARVFRRLRRDNFRSDIRRLRDALFDYVWENGHSFETSAYVQMRDTLNGLLRASTMLSPAKFMFCVWFFSKNGIPASPLREAIDEVSDRDLRSELERVNREASGRVMRFLFVDHPLGRPIVHIVSASIYFRRLREHVRRFVEALFSEFGRFGRPQLPDEQRRLFTSCP